MPFHTFGGDASESGDDEASRNALLVHDGAAAGSLFGGGTGDETGTVAAYTAPARDAKPDVDEEGHEHAKTVAVCIDSESEHDIGKNGLLLSEEPRRRGSPPVRSSK